MLLLGFSTRWPADCQNGFLAWGQCGPAGAAGICKQSEVSETVTGVQGSLPTTGAGGDAAINKSGVLLTDLAPVGTHGKGMRVPVAAAKSEGRRGCCDRGGVGELCPDAFKDLDEKTLAAVTRHFFVLEKKKKDGETTPLRLSSPLRLSFHPSQVLPPPPPPHQLTRLHSGEDTLRKRVITLDAGCQSKPQRIYLIQGHFGGIRTWQNVDSLATETKPAGGVDNVLPPRRPGLERGSEGGRQRSAKP